LKITIQDLGESTIFRCSGRLVFGSGGDLLKSVSRFPNLRIAVIDLAEITALDAAGVGALVSVRAWTKAMGIPLKLMNLTPRTENLLELLNLRTAFAICSAAEMLRLLCCAYEDSHWDLDIVKDALVGCDDSLSAPVHNHW